MKYLTELIEIFIAVVIFGALFPLINTALGNLGLDNVSVAGTYMDFSWVVTLFVLALLIGFMYIGLKQFQKK